MAEVDAARAVAEPLDHRAFFRSALPQVYGFVLARCGDARLAEDITSEAFLALARRLGQGDERAATVAWLITVARNRLIDHWRRAAREERRLRLVAGDLEESLTEAEEVDSRRLAEAFTRLSTDHRAALSLRYLDDLSVPEVAEVLGRSVHATESLLVRARSALRTAYEEVGDA